MMTAYLAAWLFLSALPFGALLVLLVLAVGGGRSALLLSPLFRPLALATPLAALLFVPVLFTLPALYAWTAGHLPAASFGRAWLRPEFFIARSIAYLLILTLLALLTAPLYWERMARGAALFALFVMALVMTLAAFDWVMSRDPALHAGSFGLLLMGGQAATAAAAAIVLARIVGAPLPRQAVALLAALSAVWAFLQFMQYLVIWSADLPDEAAWYLARDAGVLVWFGCLGGFVLPVALAAVPLPWRLRAAAPVAGVVLLVHMAEAVWLVAPAIR